MFNLLKNQTTLSKRLDKSARIMCKLFLTLMLFTFHPRRKTLDSQTKETLNNNNRDQQEVHKLNSSLHLETLLQISKSSSTSLPIKQLDYSKRVKRASKISQQIWTINSQTKISTALRQELIKQNTQVVCNQTKTLLIKKEKF